MTTFNCPHCGKSVGISVVGHQDPPKQTETTSPPTTETKPAKDLVNTQQAKQMRSKINIEGTVTKKSETRTINKKAGGTVATCDAFLVDESGEIKVQFWGEEVNSVQNGQKIRITNGYTNTFKGEVSLTKGKYGILEIIS